MLSTMRSVAMPLFSGIAVLLAACPSVGNADPKDAPDRRTSRTSNLKASAEEKDQDDLALVFDNEIPESAIPDMPEPLFENNQLTENDSHLSNCSYCAPQGGFFGGIEYLLVRPHFSEAIAFAQGSQTATTAHVSGTELQFGYDGSIRAFAGYRFSNGEGAIKLSYWNYSGDTTVYGNAPNAGQFIADPFGNIVGTVTIIDPNSRIFGTQITGGARIETRSNVEMNVYDVEFIKSIVYENCDWNFNWSVGARIADIDQYYESIITTANGTFFSGGDFSVDFIGAGPRVGFECRRNIGDGGFSLFATGHGSLLLGEYNVQSSQTTTAPVFRASQVESLTRTIPVTEAELGASWEYSDSMSVSLGWTFQSWFDFGTSGGKFGGFFGGGDDSNIMSFDGMFVRGEYTF